jgi:hypothetical protein
MQSCLNTTRLTIAEVPETRFLIFAYPSSIETEFLEWVMEALPTLKTSFVFLASLRFLNRP